MSDTTIRLVIDLTYDTDVMHGDDEDSIKWFNGILHGDDLQLGDFGDLGDMIGSVKVVTSAARIKELSNCVAVLEAKNKRLSNILGRLVFCEEAEFYSTAIERASPYCIDFEKWHKDALAELNKERSDEKGQADE